MFNLRACARTHTSSLSALVMWGRLRGHSTLNASTLGDFLDALLDSAAIYSIASVGFILPRVDYLTCIAILPQLIVSVRATPFVPFLPVR